MRRTLQVVLALLAATSLAAEPLPPPEPGVRFERSHGVQRLQVVLPGSLLSYALARRADGAHDAYLLARREGEAVEKARQEEQKKKSEGPAKMPACPSAADSPTEKLLLYRVEWPHAGELVPLRDDLPGDATAIDASDLDGDGQDEIWLARPGHIVRIDTREPTRDRVILEHPGLSLKALHPALVRDPSGAAGGRILAMDLARLSVYALGQAEEPLRPLAQVGLALDAHVTQQGISVSTRAPGLVGGLADGSLVLATPPQATGNRRLRTTTIKVAPDGSTAIVEAFSHLPDAEEVIESQVLLIDDRPWLAVMTRPAGKLSLFGEKRLRLFELRADRSRLGFAPALEVESRMNLWQTATPEVVDADGDGDLDLVMGYWKGLKDDRVVLDVYMRQADGRFSSVVKTTAFDVEDGDRSFVEYGRDLDADGHPDLLVRGGSSLLLFPGISPSGSRIVSNTPRQIPSGPMAQEAETFVGLGASSSGDVGLHTWSATDTRPSFADLDGDGRVEILLVQQGGAGGRGTFEAVRLESKPGTEN